MHTIVEEVASVDDFLRLREVAGLSARSREAAEKGLPGSLYGVQVMRDTRTIGMGRVVGDGALNFEIVDVAVEPAFQGQGLGQLIMENIMAYLDRSAPATAYITLMADVPALYEKFGFKLSRPRSEGMYIIR